MAPSFLPSFLFNLIIGWRVDERASGSADVPWNGNSCFPSPSILNSWFSVVAAAVALFVLFFIQLSLFSSFQGAVAHVRWLFKVFTTWPRIIRRWSNCCFSFYRHRHRHIGNWLPLSLFLHLPPKEKRKKKQKSMRWLWRYRAVCRSPFNNKNNNNNLSTQKQKKKKKKGDDY